MSSHKDYWSKTSKSYAAYVGSKGGNVHEKIINPYMFELLGDTKGKTILDGACGNGYFSALMSSKAKKIIGVDFTEELIKEAKEKHSNSNIEYIIGNIEKLPFKNESFDIVVCNMALMDFSNLNQAVKEISRVLKFGGVFIASILHPCFENPPYTESVRDESGIKKARIVSNYFKTGLIVDDRDPKNNYQHYHYKISDYLDCLGENDLMIEKMVEPKDSEILKDENESPAPYYIVFKAVKIKA